MFRKLVLAASAAAALGASAIAFAAPSQANEWRHGGYLDRGGYPGDDRGWGDGEDGYSRHRHHRWSFSWGWSQPRYAYNPTTSWDDHGGYQSGPEPYDPPRHRWHDGWRNQW